MTLDPAQLALLHVLLDAALDLAPAERGPWLADVRDRHPALARELESLLNSEPELDARGFLTGGPWSDASGMPEPATPPSLAGHRIGAWTLERPLGQGGMGSVWLAHRSDGRFEGQAAIKLLNLALLDPVGNERFRREGSALARLTHPNIARLVDAGITDGGQPYLVLEHIDGVRIDRHCDERALGPRERIRLFQQVLAAIGHAHAHLVVHRDIKASNILVTAGGTVKLLDFGIAKLLEGDAAGGERTDLTERGGLAFTPEYAAPEQVTGGVITTATDVYALGVLLYLLLAGRHPTAPRRGTSMQLLRAAVDTEPPRLSAAASMAAMASPDIARARASTRGRLLRFYQGDLDNILSKALRKAPTERYQTAAAFAEDLQRFLRTEPVTARPDSIWYRAGRFLRRNRIPVAAGAIVTLALMATTGFSVAQMREAREQRDTAVYLGKRAEAQSEFQRVLMSQMGDEPLTMRQVVEHGRGYLEREYAGHPRVLGSMLLQLGRRYAELGDEAGRRTVLIRADSLIALHGSATELAEARCDQVDHLRATGEYDSAWGLLASADSMRRRIGDPLLDEWCLQIRTQLALEVRDAPEAGRAIRQVLALMERRGARSGDEYFDAQTQLSQALAAEGRYRESVEVALAALAALDSLGRGRSGLYGVIEHNYALTLVDLGESREAERRLHHSLVVAAAADTSGYVHPQPLIHYAEAALSQGLADSAAKYFAQMVAQAARDSNRYWEGRGAFGLVRAQARLGRLDDARATAARFRRLRHGFPRLTATDDQLPDTLVVEGWLALAEGDTARAFDRFMASLQFYNFFDGKKQKQQRAVVLQAAEAAITLRQPESALAFAERARSIADRDSMTATRSGWVGEARLIEGKAHLAIGDTAAALTALGRAVPALRSGSGSEHRRTVEAEGLLAELSAAGRRP